MLLTLYVHILGSLKIYVLIAKFTKMNFVEEIVEFVLVLNKMLITLMYVILIVLYMLINYVEIVVFCAIYT